MQYWHDITIYNIECMGDVVSQLLIITMRDLEASVTKASPRCRNLVTTSQRTLTMFVGVVAFRYCVVQC